MPTVAAGLVAHTTRHYRPRRDRLGPPGDGPPVVLVHGTPSRSVLWRNVAPALAGHDIGVATVLRAHLLEGMPACKDRPRRRGRAPPVDHSDHPSHQGPPRRLPHHAHTRLPRGRRSTSAYRHRAADGAGAFAAYFDQWEGERGHQLWLRNVCGFDEQDTVDFEPLLDQMRTPTRLVWGEQDRFTSSTSTSRPGSPPVSGRRSSPWSTASSRPDRRRRWGEHPMPNGITWLTLVSQEAATWRQPCRRSTSTTPPCITSAPDTARRCCSCTARAATLTSAPTRPDGSRTATRA